MNNNQPPSPNESQRLERVATELELLRNACEVGAILSRRIKDPSGRVRHADEIIDDALAIIGGAK